MRHAILHKVKGTVPYQFQKTRQASLSAWPEAVRALKKLYGHPGFISYLFFFLSYPFIFHECVPN